MFEGKRFLPDTGMPIWKMDRSSTRLAVWLPDPLTVATWMLKSLMTAPAPWRAGWPASARASCGLMRLGGPRERDDPWRVAGPADPDDVTPRSYIFPTVAGRTGLRPARVVADPGWTGRSAQQRGDYRPRRR